MMMLYVRIFSVIQPNETHTPYETGKEPFSIECCKTVNFTSHASKEFFESRISLVGNSD